MRIFLSVFLVGLLTVSSTSFALFNSSPSSSSTSGFGNKTQEFVTVEQAFPFYSNQIGNTIHLEWDVLEGYYLYQQRISVSADKAVIGDLIMEDGEPYKDAFFGSVNIYTTPLTVKVPVISAEPGAKLIVQYQGCAKAGFCYPPETKTLDIGLMTDGEVSDATVINTIQNNTDLTPPSSQESVFANRLAENWWTPLLFLALGIGLAFTPCVFPMYPILTSIVLGSGKLSHARTFGLSLVYVQGMALTYTLLGLVVASAGLQFQAALQHPYVLSGLSILFVLLALSMFGLFTIQIPASVQTWLNSQSNKRQGGNMPGVFAMGAISGLVCSPCTTAPLSGALLYVAQSGDLLTGAVALYALGIGMGIPLIIVAVLAINCFPKQALGWIELKYCLASFYWPHRFI